MKNIIFLPLLLLISTIAYNQKDIKVDETNAKFDSGSQNAFSVVVYEADDKEVEKAWKKLMKDYKAKVSSKKEIFADDAAISDISANTVDVYAIIEKDKEGNSKVTVAFDLGGAYLTSSSHASEAKAAKKILRDFAVSSAKDAVLAKVKEAEKELKKMESDKDQLIKSNEDLKKKIEGWEKDIVKAKEDISNNEKSKLDKEKEITGQLDVIKKLQEKEKLIK